MQLKEFSFISPVVEAANVFKAIETVISPDVIAQTLGHTNSVEERKRKLPSSLVVCLVMAMSLWSSDSMATVLKNLVSGLSRQWTKLGKYWRVPNSASITTARQRIGCRVMSQLFARTVRPLATSETKGAFLGGLRVMAVDGTVLDIPDSQANARVFGYLNGRKTPIRSLKPREVVQEIYGWFLGYYAVRCLMCTAAQQAGISPLRIGFTGTLKVIRQSIPDFQDIQPEQLPFFSPS